MEAKLHNPAKKISSIELKIISSLQQRGLYMQKNMKYAGLQLYTIIKAESLTDELLDFLHFMQRGVGCAVGPHDAVAAEVTVVRLVAVVSAVGPVGLSLGVATQLDRAGGLGDVTDRVAGTGGGLVDRGGD